MADKRGAIDSQDAIKSNQFAIPQREVFSAISGKHVGDDDVTLLQCQAFINEPDRYLLAASRQHLEPIVSFAT